MRTIDLSPLHRFAVGFDRMQRQFDHMAREGAANTYPHYNIEVTDEDAYRITLAVAGFREGELDITVEASQLIVSGTHEGAGAPQQFLHQGIAARNFERRFELADHIKVVGANLENGLLHVDLAREVPEALKPRKIAISAAGANTTEAEAIERQAA